MKQGKRGIGGNKGGGKRTPPKKKGPQPIQGTSLRPLMKQRDASGMGGSETTSSGGQTYMPNTDPDLVGSPGQIEDFDGTFTDFGDDPLGLSGGGSGSSLTGRESVGLVGDTSGQSVEDVVYGVRSKSKKLRRPQGE